MFQIMSVNIRGSINWKWWEPRMKMELLTAWEVEIGRNMSARIVLLIKKLKHAPTERRNWWEHVSRDGAAHEMKYPRPESQRGGDMSTVMGLLMKWKYALPESKKWREQVSHNGSAHEKEIRTSCKSKVAGTYQPWRYFSWNGHTHCLWVKSGGGM